jgi:exopolyphosphatase/pppGpp-phosphohydrolase
MDLKNTTLEEWLKEAPSKKFKYGHKVDYSRSYENLKDYCIKNIHKHISLGANLVDHELFLNDHGIEHVQTVIKRASELVSSKNCDLNAKEVFYLLCAIQLHDVGNIFGRYNHELNTKEIIKSCGLLFSDDTTEQQLIWKIAKTHGGRDELTGKDTIVSLKPYKNMDGEPVRTQLIAAILRFADELADDKNRASRWPLENNIVPEKSRIFH